MPYAKLSPIFIEGLPGLKVLLPLERQGQQATHWLLVDACVALVECPHCKAKPMQLCKFDSGKRGVSTHYARRSAIKRIPKHVRLHRAQKILEDQESDDPAEEKTNPGW